MQLVTIFVALIFAISAARAAQITSETSKDGLTYLTIWGKIEFGDESKFKEEVLRLARKGVRVAGVKIYSPGGSIYAATQIGRYIRTLLIGTWVPTEYLPFVYSENNEYWTDVLQSNHCWTYNGQGNYVEVKFNKATKTGNPNCICASACFLIWAAGAGVNQQGTRYPEVSGAAKIKLSIWIHRSYFTPEEYAKWPHKDAQERYQALQNYVMEYLREMDVPDNITRKMFSIRSTELVPLSREEIATMADRSLWPPYLDELSIARCGDNMACQKEFARGIYFERLKAIDPNVSFDKPVVSRPNFGSKPTPLGPQPKPAEVRIPAGATSAWLHDGTTVYLASNPDGGRRFLYGVSPPAAESGRDNSVLFEGKREGDEFVGKVYRYWKNCRTEDFYVRGPISNENKRVTLKGRAPIKDGNCDLTFQNVQLVLDYEQNLSTTERVVKKTSFWSHNGSKMYMASDGTKRWLYYEEPREVLQEIGVARDTLLFDGALAGKRVSGKANFFSSKCGTKSYDVEGHLSPDGKRITLRGERPRLDDDCNVSGFREDELVFTFLH